MKALLSYVTLCIICVAATGCYESRLFSEAGLMNIQVTHPDVAPFPGEDTCSVLTAEDPAESRTHLEVCSELEYPTSPASSGDHFGVWAEFMEYEEPVPQGFLVHSMEHGGVVLYYNCPDGCPDVLALFRELVEGQGSDPQCETVPEVENRIIIVPNPDMNVPIAATAWERLYRATCLDKESLQEFIGEHYGQGPEDLCGGGFDGSVRGWCNHDGPVHTP